MKIRLSDISEEGKAFLWSKETAELNEALEDLIGDLPHTAEFFIRPLNSRDFELTGTMKTDVPEQCSRCGLDFSFDVDIAYHFILIPHQPDSRTGRYAKVNHLSDVIESGPDVAEYPSDQMFDMGEFIHEQVAISIPFNPAPKENKDGDCLKCGDRVRGKVFSYDEQIPEEKPQNPFAVLKNLKLQ